MLKGEYDGYMSNLYVVDCRYDYEFQYGHVRGALHANCPEELRDLFFSSIDKQSYVVFHCELSCDRGPKMAEMLREMDRTVNSVRNRGLYYRNVFVMDGGYREFHRRFPKECEGGYRPMREEKFCVSGAMAAATTGWRKGLARYQTWKAEPLLAMHRDHYRMSMGLAPLRYEEREREQEEEEWVDDERGREW
jgi:M-phase inducer tyrosine phosphatase